MGGFHTTANFYRRHKPPEDAVEALTLSLRLEQEGERWVGVCHELGTSAYADTFERALVELKEAVALQLNEVDRLGHLPLFLKDRNVTVEILQGTYDNEWSLAKAMS